MPHIPTDASVQPLLVANPVTLPGPDDETLLDPQGAGQPCLADCDPGAGSGVIPGMLGGPAGVTDRGPVRVRIGGAIRPPAKLRHVDPKYPELARVARVQGVVEIDAVIDPKGNIADVRVVSGHPLLAKAAREAVSHWVYEPTLLNGVPVACQMTVTLRFVLPGSGS